MFTLQTEPLVNQNTGIDRLGVPTPKLLGNVAGELCDGCAVYWSLERIVDYKRLLCTH